MENLSQLKDRLEQIEVLLDHNPLVVFETFQCNERKIIVALTKRLYKILRKNRLWLSNDFLVTLKNAKYGFDRSNPRSRGGQDGIFIIDRDFKPINSMTRKLYDGFIEKPNSGVKEIANYFNAAVDSFLAVRLVSHHMRLLGLLYQRGIKDWLILVDYDKTK